MLQGHCQPVIVKSWRETYLEVLPGYFDIVELGVMELDEVGTTLVQWLASRPDI